MKVKCYAIYEANKEILAEYSNPSQKTFLDYQVREEVKRIIQSRPSNSIDYKNTSNGIWYSKTYPGSKNNNRIHLVLIASESASISLATSLITKGFEIQGKQISIEKIKLRIVEVMKTFNANDSRFEKLNTNVSELEGIMKNNMSKIVGNMGDLGAVQRKSQMMSALSMQLQKDSKALQQKMKRRKLLFKLVILAIVSIVVFMVIYLLFW